MPIHIGQYIGLKKDALKEGAVLRRSLRSVADNRFNPNKNLVEKERNRYNFRPPDCIKMTEAIGQKIGRSQSDVPNVINLVAIVRSTEFTKSHLITVPHL